MCEFFSCIVARDSDDSIHIYFTNSNNHSDILSAMRQKDTLQFISHNWCRFECEPVSFWVKTDQEYVPLWVDCHWSEIEDKVRSIAKKITPIYEQLLADRELNSKIHIVCLNFILESKTYKYDLNSVSWSNPYNIQYAKLRNTQEYENKKVFDKYTEQLSKISGYVSL